jgi:hypothetical protein
MRDVRLPKEVHDPLTVTALALASPDGGEQAILVSPDAVAVIEYVTDGRRARLSEALPGFRTDMLLISATHPHTAPDQPEGVWSLRPELGEYAVTERAYGETAKRSSGGVCRREGAHSSPASASSAAGSTRPSRVCRGLCRQSHGQRACPARLSRIRVGIGLV